MNKSLNIKFLLSYTLFLFFKTTLVFSNTDNLTIQRGTELSWITEEGSRYQLQSMISDSWENLEPPYIGTGTMIIHRDYNSEGQKNYRIAVTTPNSESTTNLPVDKKSIFRIDWHSRSEIEYHPMSTSDLLDSKSWSPITEPIKGDGTQQFVVIPRTGQSIFIRVQNPINESVDIVPLYTASTVLEAETTVDTTDALITYLGDRARDRHAREDEFNSYDHYLTWYWEERTISIEIVDTVAKGGNSITVNYKTLTKLEAPEFRAFYRGINTVAEYNYNYSAPEIEPNYYTATLDRNITENRPLQIGDRIELEISQFIQAPKNGRTNYYGTAILYVVGQGIVPWEAKGQREDSFPMPESGWLGGLTTLPYQYSNEPEHRFKQIAGNLSPYSAQPFMLGRRLHHTNFNDGTHSENGNPTYTEQVGKRGPKFIASSCVECHINNGRALPSPLGSPITLAVIKVGSDSSGAPHPILGSAIQTQNTDGFAEARVSISHYSTIEGQYADGKTYALRKPNYSFLGTNPEFYSVRNTPPLVGLGLLEAISEEAILALADPNDANEDGISGRAQVVIDPVTGETRLGRFTHKAGKASLSQQIAAALNNDMGVSTTIFPNLDGESGSGEPELSDDDLDYLTRYIAVLGVSARRNLSNSDALQGEQHFETLGCVKCHIPTITTSPYHPFTELRTQTIHPYTDLLLHDMGAGLADNMGELSASGAEWRTPPLWNIGLTEGVSGGESYLHDGRARSLAEAILWHGGEANSAKEAFRNLSESDRSSVISFLKSL